MFLFYFSPEKLFQLPPFITAAAADLQLCIDVFHVGLYCVFGQEQASGDLLVADVFRCQSGDLKLPLRKP